MNFSDLRIGKKLGLGFGVIVLLCAAVGIAGLLGLKRVHERSEEIANVKDIQKGFTEARLNLRNFTVLKDTQFYDRSRVVMKHVTGLLDSLKPHLSVGENGNLIKDLGEGLNEYATLMEINKTMILSQVQLIEQLRKYAIDFRNESNSLKIPETHFINYHFALARINANYIQMFSRDENYNEAKAELEKVINEAEKSGKGTLASIAGEYLSVVNQYMEVVRSYRDVDPKQLAAGKKALDSADKLAAIINDYVDASKKATEFFLIMFFLISSIVGILISYLMTRYFTGHIKNGVRLAEIYASGELTFHVPENHLKLKDEVGDLTRAMVSMGNKIKEVILTISREASIVSSASAQISATTLQLSEGANEQASSVEEISSSMEEIAASVQQNTENSSAAESISSLSAEMIRDVAKAAQQSLDSVRKITGKIGIINDIAFQTNILALNAAVEAARAGEHGRGFAVVAAEVRKLAENSKNAASEIVDLIGTSLKVTEESEVLLNKVIPEIEKSAQLIREIASSSIEQNAGSEQINNAIQQLNQLTQENASSAEELASSADELAREAEKLKNATSFFKVEEELMIKGAVKNVNSRIKNQDLNKPVKPKVNPKQKQNGVQIDMAEENYFEKY